MSELMSQFLSSATGECPPDCVRAQNAQEDYDASQSAALVAVNLIRSALVILKLETVDTEYSAQFLVDNVWSKKEDGQGEHRRDLTVKECLQFAFKNGLLRREHWAHLGCTFKAPAFACHIPRVPIKGEVIEVKTLAEALKLLRKQPVGARVHVFSPEFGSVKEDEIYDGPSSDGTRYVGLRDVIIVADSKIKGTHVVTVQVFYKKKVSFVNVPVCPMILPLSGGDESQVTEPTCLLVDFCLPRLSVN